MQDFSFNGATISRAGSNPTFLKKNCEKKAAKLKEILSLDAGGTNQGCLPPSLDPSLIGSHSGGFRISQLGSGQSAWK